MSDQVRREEVRFRSGDINLAGTFTLPPTNGPAAEGPVPAVLMLQGSGRTDRDDNAKALAVNVFPQLSAAIERHGLATFRPDLPDSGSETRDVDDRAVVQPGCAPWCRRARDVHRAAARRGGPPQPPVREESD